MALLGFVLGFVVLLEASLLVASIPLVAKLGGGLDTKSAVSLSVAAVVICLGWYSLFTYSPFAYTG